MARYHINQQGDPGVCRALKGQCPFGSEDEHFKSAEEARAGYEQLMASAPFANFAKGQTSSAHPSFQPDQFDSEANRAWRDLTLVWADPQRTDAEDTKMQEAMKTLDSRGILYDTPVARAPGATSEPDQNALETHQVSKDGEIADLWWVTSSGGGTMENFPSQQQAEEWAQRRSEQEKLKHAHQQWEESKRLLINTLQGGSFTYSGGPGQNADSFRQRARMIKYPVSFSGPHRHQVTPAEQRKIDKLELTAALMDASSGKDSQGIRLQGAIESHGSPQLKKQLASSGYDRSRLSSVYHDHLAYLEQTTEDPVS